MALRVCFYEVLAQASLFFKPCLTSCFVAKASSQGEPRKLDCRGNREEFEMSENRGLLDSLAHMFKSPKAGEDSAQAGKSGKTLQVDFESAVRRLEEKVEERLRRSLPAGARTAAGTTALDRKSRQELAHREIRKDIGEMHARLGTGIDAAELEELSSQLAELDRLWRPGKGSHELIPRARYAIAEKVQLEAGPLAVARLRELLSREGMSWPDATHHHPSASEDEIERSLRRRFDDIEATFLSNDLKRTTDRMLGIVTGWGGDYPARGSALWEETVLEGVAEGIRARLDTEFIDLIRENKEVFEARTEELVGETFQVLQRSLESGVDSIEDASRAVAATFRALDEVIPQIAWEYVHAQLPHARAEWDV